MPPLIVSRNSCSKTFAKERFRRAAAEQRYGVVIDLASMQIDEKATRARRIDDARGSRIA